ncbi:hypothetical protein P12x_002130 [Tundrisphaera lichenicola]|uniref:hypothetical protein n=1 Tax=Tundrisphaera lichenicola TaxID=2029860 RepID=UPI003EBD28AF
MNRARRTHAFRPQVESSESRVLATTGLAAAVAHPAAHAAEKVAQVHSWIKIVNPTNHSLKFQLSGNGGNSYHTFTLRAKSAATYHVAHSAPDFFIRFGQGPSTPLPSGPTKAGRPVYTLHTPIFITPNTPTQFPGAGGGFGDQVIRGPIRFVNTSSVFSNSVTIQLSFNGRQFQSFGIRYTDGRTPQAINVPNGTTRIDYRFAGGQAMQLTSFGTYSIFYNTNAQPYLFPST